MAASLDGEPIVLGDSVYDMIWGPGTVVQLHESGNFVVRFGATRTATFTSGGVNARYPGRTLFWHDPIIVLPIKRESRWLLVQQLVASIVGPVRTWAGP